jgi:hypothetical protein
VYHWVADANAHVQRLVSVDKMATMFDECITEEQRSVVHFLFCGKKDTMQMIFIEKCIMFKVKNVCCVKRFTTGWQSFEVETEVRKRLRKQFKKLICCGFQDTGQAMVQVYHCWWRICQEIYVFPSSNITCLT